MTQMTPLTQMTQIESIVLREIRLPLKEPFRISSGIVSERRICLLELTDADGTTGWSECVAGEEPNYSAETIDTAWHAIKEWFAPRVIGAAFDHPDSVAAVLEKHVCGHNMAKAAVEMGCWDVAARRPSPTFTSWPTPIRRTSQPTQTIWPSSTTSTSS
jgi:O-succinylbenzoate synthase